MDEVNPEDYFTLITSNTQKLGETIQVINQTKTYFDEQIANCADSNISDLIAMVKQYALTHCHDVSNVIGDIGIDLSCLLTFQASRVQNITLRVQSIQSRMTSHEQKIAANYSREITFLRSHIPRRLKLQRIADPLLPPGLVSGHIAEFDHAPLNLDQLAEISLTSDDDFFNQVATRDHSYSVAPQLQKIDQAPRAVNDSWKSSISSGGASHSTPGTSSADMSFFAQKPTGGPAAPTAALPIVKLSALSPTSSGGPPSSHSVPPTPSVTAPPPSAPMPPPQQAAAAAPLPRSAPVAPPSAPMVPLSAVAAPPAPNLMSAAPPPPRAAAIPQPPAPAPAFDPFTSAPPPPGPPSSGGFDAFASAAPPPPPPDTAVGGFDAFNAAAPPPPPPATEEPQYDWNQHHHVDQSRQYDQQYTQHDDTQHQQHDYSQNYDQSYYQQDQQQDQHHQQTTEEAAQEVDGYYDEAGNWWYRDYDGEYKMWIPDQ